MSNKNKYFPEFFFISFTFLGLLIFPNEWYVYSLFGLISALFLKLLDAIFNFIVKTIKGKILFAIISFILANSKHTEVAAFLKNALSIIN